MEVKKKKSHEYVHKNTYVLSDETRQIHATENSVKGGSTLTLISFMLILMWQINPVIVASFAFMDK